MANGQDSILQNIGLGLQGFGAGVQGRLPEFFQQRENQRQALDDKRREALLLDNRSSLRFLQSGDTASATDLLRNRAADIERLGGDPSDTLGQLQLIESGDIQSAMTSASILDQRAVDEGFFQPLAPPPQAKVIGQKDNKVLVRTPEGNFEARDIQGLSPDVIPDKVIEVKDGVVTREAKDGTVYNEPIKDFVQKEEVIKFSDLSGVNKEVGKLVQAANDSKAAASALTNLNRTKSSTDKLAAIFKFMKALDPASVVREGEQDQAVATTGVGGIFQGYINQIRGTGRLSDEAFDQMTTTARSLANQSITDSNDTVESYLGGFGQRLNKKEKTNLSGRIPTPFENVNPNLPIVGEDQTLTPAPQITGTTDGEFTIGGASSVQSLSDEELLQQLGAQ